MKKLVLYASLLGLCSFTFLILQDWQIAPGHSIRFDGKYAHGTFNELSGLITFDPHNPESAKFDVTVDVNSIDTGIDLKNKHARSEKWFDSEKFPTISFKSEEVSKVDSGYVVKGELTMRGIVKEVAIPFTYNTIEKSFRGKFSVNRGDFGLGKVNGKDSDSTTVEVFVPVLPR
jgi:polyisoprenoid-binding protein YceI